MSQHLVIVESPAKAKTIEKFLGADYKVLELERVRGARRWIVRFREYGFPDAEVYRVEVCIEAERIFTFPESVPDVGVLRSFKVIGIKGSKSFSGCGV